MFQLYKITNKKNGKFYIGVHKGDVYEDGYYGSGLLINRAINKYGKENFKREVLREYDSKEKVYAVEERLVNKSLIEDDKCYNLMKGGICGPVQIGNNNSAGIEPWNKGMTLPEYSKENHPRSLFSKEDRQYVCELYKDGKPTTTISEMYDTSKGVICKLLESEGIERRTRDQYDSLTGKDHPMWIEKDEEKICQRYKNGESTYDIADDLECSESVISNVLKRHNIERRGNVKAVLQFLNNGVFVGAYDSALEASKITNCYRSGISSTCAGNQKTCKGFKWRYVDYGW